MGAERVVWISHRGIRERYVENTYEAFATACERGFCDLETDLRCTSDGHIVLSHDPDLQRVARKSSVVAQSTRKDLEAVALDQGQRLLFFEQFVEKFAGCNWIFDVKPETGKQVVDTLKRWVEGQKSESWLLQQSRFLFWNADHQHALLEAFPKAVCLARQDECWRTGVASLLHVPALGGIKKDKVYAMPPRLFNRIALYRSTFVRAYTERGAKVMAFLPQSIGDMEQAIDVGIEEILTDGLKL